MSGQEDYDGDREVAHPEADDPFFKLIGYEQWNACLGKQGCEENYLDGYIEAAIELTDTLFAKPGAKLDTLILPILFNARHSIELILKFTFSRLAKANIIKKPPSKPHHKIKVYWQYLHQGDIGDEALSQKISSLKRYVDSLSAIDPFGVELRYFRNVDGTRCLDKCRVINMLVVRDSLNELKGLISALKYRVEEFIEERQSGYHTERCSRTDLLMIAKLMPPPASWNLESFSQAKETVKARYKLNNAEFTEAINRILENREMRSILGVESDLLYLTDDDVVWVGEQWRRLHPVESKGDDIVNAADLFELFAKKTPKNEIIKLIKTRFSTGALAELEAMRYLVQNQVFAECHEHTVESLLKRPIPDLEEKIDYLMSKTTLLQDIQIAAAKLGRLSLSERLKVI